MNAERLLATYERVADAPDAIARLRRFVLDLAVRGKLAPQDANDVPARDLLNRIALDRSRLAKAGEIKRRPELPSLNDDEVPFEIPRGWEWARFAEVASVLSNLVNPRGFGSFPHIAPDNIESRTGRLLAYETITQSGVFSAKHLFSAGCLLYSKIRPALAKVTPVDFEGLCSADMYPIQSHIDRFYLHKFMLAEIFVGQSVIEDTRVAMPKINQEALSKILIAVPPLAEQHRIVAKVEELMALCDQLEAARAEREAARDRLAAASLVRLNAPDPATFANDARFALDALPVLTARPDQIKQLRQTILNLAMRGKLAAQDASDESASALLKRIAAEKARLREGGQLKKYEPIAELTHSNQLDLAVPKGWAVTDLQSICATVSDGDHLPPPKAAKGIPFLVIGNVRNQQIDFAGSRHVSAQYYEALDPIRRPKSGDLLYTLVGSYGIPVIVRSDEPFCVQRHIGILRPMPSVSVFYLAWAMQSRMAFDQATACATGIAQKTVPLAGLRKMVLPLPPRSEQDRIVARVEELMALCDRLEASLAATAATRRHLLDALLAEALAPVEDREMAAAE